jgi:tetratricopeptide (TPR) repeat protein
MGLEKGTFARRKAQKLARDGEIARAIEEMRVLAGDADSDPYDHVYLGDLLMREGRPQEALDAWMEAVQSYGRAGLNRNAIAVGKKVLRLDHGRVAVHRTLGELYCREGLVGEAMPHFLHWLDTVNGDARFSEEFLATLESAGSAVGLQVEAALRLGDHYSRAGLHDRAARMLHELADKAQDAGSPEIASELRERARSAERAHTMQEADEHAADDATIEPPAVDAGPDEDAAAGDPFPDVAAATPPFGSSIGHAAELPVEAPVCMEAGLLESPLADSPVEAPAEAPFDASVQASRVASVDAPAEASVEESVEAAVEVPAEASVDESVEAAVETSAEAPLEVPIETSAEARFEATVELPVEAPFEPPLRQQHPASPSSLLEPSATDSFVVEHFPVGGSGFEPSIVVPVEPGALPCLEDSEARSGRREEIEDASADEVSEDDERIWDLDAEQEALQGESSDAGEPLLAAEPEEPTAEPNLLELPGGARSRPDVPAVGPDVSAHSAWGGTPDETEGSAGPDQDEISWPSGVTVRSLIDHAETAYGSGRWAEARELYDRAAHETSLEPMVLRRLAEIARKLNDSSAEVHYLEQLGDAWIEAGVMEEALEVFLEVLRIDPDSCTARRRLSRFQEMGVPGAERVPEATRESVQGVLEGAGARTCVRDDPASTIQSDEWIDLGALIEEFRDGIKNQIAGDDPAGHYDLAVSHHGMELFEEAVEELDLVLACPGLSVEMELHARELRGVCLLALRRDREAVHEFRIALERPVPDTESRCSVLYHLGLALEAAEEWREAADIFDRVHGELPGFLDAEARHRACEMRANGIDPEARAA